MSVRIYLDLSAAHKRDWASERRNVEGSGVGPACCLSIAIREGLTPRPALEMGSDWYVSEGSPSCLPRLKPRWLCGYPGAPVEQSEATCNVYVGGSPLSRKCVAPAAAGGLRANLREANLQAKPIPRGRQKLQGSRGAVTSNLFYYGDF